MLDSERFGSITILELAELGDSLARTNSLNELVTRHNLSLGVGLVVNIGKVGQDTGVLGTGNSGLFHIVGDHSNGELSGVQSVFNILLNTLSEAVLKSKGQQVLALFVLLEVSIKPILEQVLLLSLITFLEVGKEVFSVDDGITERDASKSILSNCSNLSEFLFFTEFAVFIMS